ncbi:DNA recombination protein RmuC [Propionivibrio sp.]|uniref:DNA recombination protein RmuC n=1 Tax=Propionivibrio sp. TaxID=2212460 RepID=UPI0025E13F8B|nr:DNA recombination protein RmuC [Propionivibrio sp.]MBK7356062.1 DNA recombination protein RmuC [Propionivibrio sp.]MBK8400270.1 DNA recombination protein RmuC [Propionivibrio sp.]MBK8744023.1 DNA recombination protein RmuC [Propionivibrio sp.]MBK8893027.1 DNA recombination protein RmuC [Propionivibrio sp.]MBL0207291.1 DNA recombination protein RmuC [Propionivibrio sp.]
MSEFLLYGLAVLGILMLGLQLRLLLRSGRKDDVLNPYFRAVESGLERVERELRDEMARGRQEALTAARGDREEQSLALDRLAQTLSGQVGQLGNLQGQQLESFAQQLIRLTQSNEQRFEQLRLSIEGRLGAMQADNASKLEEMRKTVDEKLHETLEQRLGDSFKLVSERLEQVHKGLGEMQSLAAGVGDLKKVLTNVKTRGTWGEVQLEALLEQVLTAEQYRKNVITRPNGNERVEFAICLPGNGMGEDDKRPVWLPIDAKFPMEDYQRLVDAQERSDPLAVEVAAKALELRLRDEAKKIRDKYVEPPYTTDFAILYLPTEGLYAEVLRRPGLADGLQRDYRISVAGPTTLSALLNSLQMGFRTLAIEKRSSEVWRVLGAIKTEFGKFGDVLEATRKKLEQATRSIESAGVRTRQIERKLKGVEALPVLEAQTRLGELEEIETPEEDA